MSAEEDREFLKVIKKSDYRVVDQLNQTPSKVYILSLLMSFKAHKIALLKLLNDAYVAYDISLNKFYDMVAKLSVGSCLMFTNDDLPSNGPEHNTAFHISIQCTYITLARVLVDTSSSLYMLWGIRYQYRY